MKSNAGMGLLVAIVLLGVVSAGVAFAAPAMYRVVSEINTEETIVDMQMLRYAIAGNPRVAGDTGYVGTMGMKPAKLSDLWIKGTQPSFVYNAASKSGTGWIGPYVHKLPLEHMLSLDKDRFGAAYNYVTTPFTRPSDGKEVSIRIQSSGADGVMNSGDDLISDILTGELFSTVTGRVMNGNQPVKSATVFLNQPSGGSTTQLSAVTDSNGVFVFPNVSFGMRSITVAPTLTYDSGSAKVTSANGRNLRFRVTSYAPDPVIINSITVVYTPSTGFYERLRIGHHTVFDYDDNGGVRLGSGDTWLFPNRTIDGSNQPTPVVVFSVHQETTITPDINITGVGQSVVIDLMEFRDNRTGGGGNHSVSGKTFTVTFNDGSQNTFVVP